MSGSKPKPRHLEVCVDEMARHSAGKKVARGSVHSRDENGKSGAWRLSLLQSQLLLKG